MANKWSPGCGCCDECECSSLLQQSKDILCVRVQGFGLSPSGLVDLSYFNGTYDLSYQIFDCESVNGNSYCENRVFNFADRGTLLRGPYRPPGSSFDWENRVGSDQGILPYVQRYPWSCPAPPPNKKVGGAEMGVGLSTTCTSSGNPIYLVGFNFEGVFEVLEGGAPGGIFIANVNGFRSASSTDALVGPIELQGFNLALGQSTGTGFPLPPTAGPYGEGIVTAEVLYC